MTNDSEAGVQRQLDAYNARDVDALLTIYADDAQTFEHPSKLLASGSRQLRDRFTARFLELNLYAALLKRVIMGNIVVDHEEVTRTFPEGPGSIELLMIYEIQNGKIAKAQRQSPEMPWRPDAPAPRNGIRDPLGKLCECPPCRKKTSRSRAADGPGVPRVSSPPDAFPPAPANAGKPQPHQSSFSSWPWIRKIPARSALQGGTSGTGGRIWLAGPAGAGGGAATAGQGERSRPPGSLHTVEAPWPAAPVRTRAPLPVASNRIR
jgi:hypothetical protein